MISKKQTPLDIVEAFPQTDPVFRAYDGLIGKCLLCHCLFDTLETIAKQYDLDLEEMIRQLESATDSPAGSVTD